LKEEMRLLHGAALSYGGCNTLDKLKHFVMVRSGMMLAFHVCEESKRSRVSFVRSEDLWRRRSSWRGIQGVQWANKKWPFVFVKEILGFLEMANQ
jgi:hypothetical protein